MGLAQQISQTSTLKGRAEQDQLDLEMLEGVEALGLVGTLQPLGPVSCLQYAKPYHIGNFYYTGPRHPATAWGPQLLYVPCNSLPIPIFSLCLGVGVPLMVLSKRRSGFSTGQIVRFIWVRGLLLCLVDQLRGALSPNSGAWPSVCPTVPGTMRGAGGCRAHLGCIVVHELLDPIRLVWKPFKITPIFS